MDKKAQYEYIMKMEKSISSRNERKLIAKAYEKGYSVQEDWLGLRPDLHIEESYIIFVPIAEMDDYVNRLNRTLGSRALVSCMRDEILDRYDLLNSRLLSKYYDKVEKERIADEIETIDYCLEDEGYYIVEDRKCRRPDLRSRNNQFNPYIILKEGEELEPKKIPVRS